MSKKSTNHKKFFRKAGKIIGTSAREFKAGAIEAGRELKSGIKSGFKVASSPRTQEFFKGAKQGLNEVMPAHSKLVYPRELRIIISGEVNDILRENNGYLSNQDIIYLANKYGVSSELIKEIYHLELRSMYWKGPEAYAKQIEEAEGFTRPKLSQRKTVDLRKPYRRPMRRVPIRQTDPFEAITGGLNTSGNYMDALGLL